jgi:hypothetical protein
MQRVVLTLLGVFLPGLAAVPAAAQPAAVPPVVAPAAAPAAAASEWPHTISRDGAHVTVYQPQAEDWSDRRTLRARAAIAITPAGAAKPLLGTIEVSLQTATDEAADIVELSEPKLLATHFPTLDTQQAASLETKIAAALPNMQTRQVPLSSVLLSLKQNPVKSVELHNDPPKIFYADHPASLVVFDGDPVMAPTGAAGLSYAVNTNWDVFTVDGTWFLLNNGIWLKAAAATGPYEVTAQLPPAFNALPAGANFADTRKALPPRAPKPGTPLPAIFVSTVPAAIILTDGAPKFLSVAGTALQRVSNSPNTLFFHTGEHQFYVQLSGRWFSATSLDGPWTFATDRLPLDFALIPPESPEAAVLPSVPGTAEAQEAVLQAQIPTTATLKRSAAKLTVVYAGPPRFAPIPGTAIAHAVNTQSVVLKIGGKYYACEAGAWFVAASPTGPWALADSIPPEVRTIPPSSPYYYVTYVQVYGATPVAVTYGYTAGYTLGFVTAGVLVYGTGYYYPPVVVPAPVPVFLPYPTTYAGQVWYNSSSGAWVRGGSVWGPYYGASGARAYNPTTGAWAQGGTVWGPYGGAGAWSAYNPSTGSYAHGSAAWNSSGGAANASYYNARTGVSGSTNQNWNAYSRWGSSTFTGPNQTVTTQSRSNANGSAGSFQSSTGAEGAGYHNQATGTRGGAVKTSNGDVYAGRDGNVYQHTDSGWSKWNNGGWQPVNPPQKTSGNTSGNTLGTTSQNTPQSTPHSGSGNRWQSGAGSTGSGRSANVDSNSWSQLQQDRTGREFGRSESGRSESGRSESGRSESGRSESGRGEFGGGEFGGERAFGRGEFGGGRFRR